MYTLFEEWFRHLWLASGLMFTEGLIIAHLAITIPYVARVLRKGNWRSGVILAEVIAQLVIAIVIRALIYSLLALTHG